MRLRFTPTARSQFLHATAYIRRNNPGAAAEFRRTAEKTLRRLTRFPNSGRTLPEFPELPHREVIVSPYRFFYRVKGKTVWILAVWHGAQLPAEPSSRREG
jgi:plasmid stabilization system protein ParE